MTSLSQHLAQEHKLSPQAQYISEIVYGWVDGIVTTFAVVAGFAWAWSESHIAQLWSLSVVLFGLANLMGDGVSMALGKYLSTRSEQDLYQTARDKESYEITHNQQMEYDECIDILTQQGMKTQDATIMIDVMKSYPHIRVKWMMDNELEMSDVRHENASCKVWLLFVFYLFGTIPLVPYLFTITQDNHRTVSIIMTGLALLLLGLVVDGLQRSYCCYDFSSFDLGYCGCIGCISDRLSCGQLF